MKLRGLKVVSLEPFDGGVRVNLVGGIPGVHGAASVSYDVTSTTLVVGDVVELDATKARAKAAAKGKK